MKKLLLVGLIGLCLTAQAQVPYGGNYLRNFPDNSGAKVNYYLNAPSVTQNKNGKDSLNFYPNAGQYVIQIADSVFDTVIFVPRFVATNYVNDVFQIEWVTANNSTAGVRFRNKYNTMFKFSTVADSTVVPGAKKHVRMVFWYDGIYFAEQSKTTW